MILYILRDSLSVRSLAQRLHELPALHERGPALARGIRLLFDNTSTSTSSSHRVLMMAASQLSKQIPAKVAVYSRVHFMLTHAHYYTVDPGESRGGGQQTLISWVLHTVTDVYAFHKDVECPSKEMAVCDQSRRMHKRQ